jgi:hypothetical protein
VKIVAFAVAAVAGAACAPSRPSLERVTERNAAYNTDFLTVWNAAKGELSASFYRFEIEDAEQGVIETGWRRVEKMREADPSRVAAEYVFRVRVKLVAEGSGWRIELDGEAALYRPNMSKLQPYRHGDIDEPPWVQGRIDAVRAAMHRRLADKATLSRPTIVL